MSAQNDFPARPEAKPGPMRIARYVGGKSTVSGGTNRTIKLSSNENPHGSSPKAREALIECAKSLHLYPDGGATALREAIADAEGLDPARIVCGAGSDELISLLCTAYAGPGDTVLHSAHGFLMYRITALACGAEPVSIPEIDLTADIDGLIAAADETTKLVFLANPNNPTGTLIPNSEIRRLRAELPPHTLLVIDSAYAEYVIAEGYEAGAKLVAETENTVMTRTFSKAHGLAALRLGWCYAPESVVDALNRVRGPFNVGAPSLAAGLASIGDPDFIDFSREDNLKQRARVAEALAAMGIESCDSHGNFLLSRFGENGVPNAADADAFLQTRGLIVRWMEGYGLAEYLRISIGTAEENGVLLAAMQDLPR